MPLCVGASGRGRGGSGRRRAGAGTRGRWLQRRHNTCAAEHQARIVVTVSCRAAAEARPRGPAAGAHLVDRHDLAGLVVPVRLGAQDLDLQAWTKQEAGDQPCGGAAAAVQGGRSRACCRSCRSAALSRPLPLASPAPQLRSGGATCTHGAPPPMGPAACGAAHPYPRRGPRRRLPGSRAWGRPPSWGRAPPRPRWRALQPSSCGCGGLRGREAVAGEGRETAGAVLPARILELLNPRSTVLGPTAPPAATDRQAFTLPQSHWRYGALPGLLTRHGHGAAHGQHGCCWGDATG
jgi:hypothetical protein